MNKIVTITIIFFGFITNAFSQNAQDIINNLKTELKTTTDQKRKVSIYSDLTWYYSNISTDSALVYGNIAIKESLQLGDSLAIAQSYGDIGVVYLKKGDYNQCLNNFNKTLKIRISKKDFPGIAKTYSGIALLYNTQSNYQLAMKNYLMALEYANKTNDDKIKNNIKNAMSGLFLDLKDYKKALLYSTQAIAFYENIKALPTLCPMYANKGNIYLGLKDTINALKMYDKAKLICNETGNKLFLAKTLNNIGIIKVAQKKYQESDKVFKELQQNKNVVNSGMFDFRMKFNDIDILNRAQKFKEAKVLLLNLKKYFINHQDNQYLLNTYRILLPVCANLKEIDSVSFYQIKFLELNNKINDQDIYKKTIELETKYQTVKKEKLIAEQEAENKRQNLLNIIISIIALFTALFGYLIYKQQKLKNKQQIQEFDLKSAIVQIENQNKLQEQRLSISRDLHDNIGAQLTFVISSIDNLKFANKITDNIITNQLTKISDFTKSTIIELRDTIWAMNANQFTYEDLHSRILNFIEKAKAAKEGINFTFIINEQLKTLKFSSLVGINLYRTIQEAINNAIKYADAKNISVNVTKENKELKIEIKDDGKGFDIENTEFGNGLFNMNKRITEVNGTIDIRSTTDVGTSIIILLNQSKTS